MLRDVMINGLVYTSHELREMTVIIGELIVVRVESSADGLDPVSTFPTLPYEDGMTASRAESLVFAQPDYAEYVDPNEKLDEVLEILTDEQAEQVPEAFREWQADTEYSVGDRRRYGSLLYKCVQAHTSQEGWEPPNAASLWSRIGEGEIPEWVQPTGAQDAYAKGDHVMHDGKEWESLVDGNVWEPGATGTEALWEEV